MKRYLEVPDVIKCSIYLELLDDPIELVHYRSHVYCMCLCIWLEIINNLSCPCCYSNHLVDFSTLQPASPIVYSIISNNQFQCSTYKTDVPLSVIHSHHMICSNVDTSSCKNKLINDILQIPTTVPLNQSYSGT